MFERSPQTRLPNIQGISGTERKLQLMRFERLLRLQRQIQAIHVIRPLAHEQEADKKGKNKNNSRPCDRWA
jgi:hypothetical protein